MRTVPAAEWGNMRTVPAAPNHNAVLSMLWIAEREAGGAECDQEDLLPELDPEEFTLRRKRWPSRR